MYENAPDFVISKLEATSLWDDLIALLEYDDTGLFSGWRDGSGAVLKIVKNFPLPDLLFKNLQENPKVLKRIYRNLDGIQKIEGEQISNKDFFCTLLLALSAFNKKANYTGKTFTIGKGYKVDSNINEDNDREEDKILLQQQKTVVRKVTRAERDDYGISTGYHTEELRSLENDGEGEYFNPLDMVILKDGLTGDEEYVPAIYVKLLADNEEWAQVRTAIAVTLLLATILLSAGTLAAGTASVAGMVVAAADLAIAVTDLTMLGLKDVLDEKNWFVANWNRISLGIGAATLSPLLAMGILKNGPKLMAALSDMGKEAAIKNFIHSAIATVIINVDIANFTKNSLKPLISANEVYKASVGVLRFADISNLQKEGVLFVKGELQAGKQVKQGFIVFYRGEVLVSGEAKVVRDALEDVFKARTKNLVAALDNFTNTVGIVTLGRSRLSQIGLNFRRTLVAPQHDGNIAVFEFFRDGKYETKAFTTLTKEELSAVGHTKKLHAEELGFDWLEKNGIQDVKSIYSELEPCSLKGHKCKDEISKRFPEAKVSYSYNYNNKAGTMPKAIADRLKDLKKKLK